MHLRNALRSVEGHGFSHAYKEHKPDHQPMRLSRHLARPNPLRYRRYKMPDVFISYPHQAAHDASLLAGALSEKGISTSFASRDLPAGEWKSKIEDELGRARAVVFVVTRASASPWVRDEYMSALESYWSGKTKLLIPLLVGHDVDVPGFLQQWSYIRVEKKSDWARAAEKVADRLRTHDTPRTEPVPQLRNEWHSRLSSIERAAKDLQRGNTTAPRKGVGAEKRKAAKATKRQAE